MRKIIDSIHSSFTPWSRPITHVSTQDIAVVYEAILPYCLKFMGQRRSALS